MYPDAGAGRVYMLTRCRIVKREEIVYLIEIRAYKLDSQRVLTDPCCPVVIA